MYSSKRFQIILALNQNLYQQRLHQIAQRKKKASVIVLYLKAKQVEEERSKLWVGMKLELNQEIRSIGHWSRVLSKVIVESGFSNRWSENDWVEKTRFTRSEFYYLCKTLRLPNIIHTNNHFSIKGSELFLSLLIKLASDSKSDYLNTISQILLLNPSTDSNLIRSLLNYINDWLYLNHSKLLQSFNQKLIQPNILEHFSIAFSAFHGGVGGKYNLLGDKVGSVIGTCVRQVFTVNGLDIKYSFNGDDKSYQSVLLLNGLIWHVFPVVATRDVLGTFFDSKLENYLENNFKNVEGEEMHCISTLEYYSKAASRSSTIRGPINLETIKNNSSEFLPAIQYNRQITEIQKLFKWTFGNIYHTWPQLSRFIPHNPNSSSLPAENDLNEDSNSHPLSNSSKLFMNGIFLSNCLTCLGIGTYAGGRPTNLIAQQFGISPPSLEEYVESYKTVKEDETLVSSDDF